jgi:hypothetical protein
MKKKKNSNISILIVSKDREFELKRLLISLDKSSKFCNEYLNVFLGIEKNTYKDLPKLKNIQINKIFFNNETSPIIIKNYLYNLNLSFIKIFLDDDVEIRRDLIKNIKLYSKKYKDCFFRLNPVKYFTKIKKKIIKTSSLEFVGFVEIGKKKLDRLINLSFVAEDTELCNRIKFLNFKIYQASDLQIIHHISNKNRNLEKINYNGISNSIEILRRYGALNNFKAFNELVFNILISIIYFKNFKNIKILLKKIFTTNIGIKFFYNKEVILPPYKNYFLSDFSDNKKRLFKIKKFKNIKKYIIARLCTFEKYQELEKIINKAIYVGPKNDKIKINSKFIFSNENKSHDTFINLLNFKKKSNKNINLVISIDDQIISYEQLYLQLNNSNFKKTINNIDECVIFKNKSFFRLNIKDYLKFMFKFNFIAFPIKFLSLIIIFILILPIKFKERINL